jgi:hypothetical protein
MRRGRYPATLRHGDQISRTIWVSSVFISKPDLDQMAIQLQHSFRG